MRSLSFSVLLACSLGGCATVSMVASEAMVETNLPSSESSLRNVSDAYTELAERKNWVARNKGILGFARVLMDGASESDQDESNSYAKQVQQNATYGSAQIEFIRVDIEGASHGLDVATMEVDKLFSKEQSAKSLRADLLSYESALVTAKKARRTFVETLAELEIGNANTASYALAEFDVSIDKARDAADKLAVYAADQKTAESLS